MLRMYKGVRIWQHGCMVHLPQNSISLQFYFMIHKKISIDVEYIIGTYIEQSIFSSLMHDKYIL